MIVAALLLGLAISPGDSARAAVTLGNVSDAAVAWAQMAAVRHGPWLVEYGRLLEASGRFRQAHTAYGLALGNTTEPQSARWLLNRRRGVLPLDTALVVTVTVTNDGSASARNFQLIMPEPVAHPPFQQLTVTQSDFTASGGLLSATVPVLQAGASISLSIEMQILQTPWSARPLGDPMDVETLAWLSETLRGMPVPGTHPGPCVPMSMELSALMASRGIETIVTGGLMADGDSLVFHAWAETDPGNIRIDPLLFATDSLLAVGHYPTDIIPLWSLDATDGYELSILFSEKNAALRAAMRAEFRPR